MVWSHVLLYECTQRMPFGWIIELDAIAYLVWLSTSFVSYNFLEVECLIITKVTNRQN